MQYEECRITAREDDDFVCSYLRFNSFSHYQRCSDLWPLKVKRDRMLYQITQLSELFLDDFVCSYLRFSARSVQCMKTYNTTIRFSETISTNSSQ